MNLYSRARLNRSTRCPIAGSQPPLMGHAILWVPLPFPPALPIAHLGKVSQCVGLIIHLPLLNLHTPQPAETGQGRVRCKQVDLDTSHPWDGHILCPLGTHLWHAPPHGHCVPPVFQSVQDLLLSPGRSRQSRDKEREKKKKHNAVLMPCSNMLSAYQRLPSCDKQRLPPVDTQHLSPGDSQRLAAEELPPP